MRSASFSRLAAGCMMTLTVLLISACGGSSNPISVSISPGTTQSIDQGQTLSFTATLANDSSNAGVTWTVSGGGTLTNSTATGVTYNAPATVTSVTTVTMTATSVTSTAQTATASITVNPAPAITTSGALTAGMVNAAYSATLTATGGSGTLTWSLASGALPTGLSLSSAGVISGTPASPIAASFTVKVTDSSAATPLSATSSAITIAVNSVPLAISTLSLTGAVQNKAYTSAAVTATGGVGIIHWTATGLPSGLALSAATGSSVQIKGTPTLTGTFSGIVVTATDSGGAFQQTKSTPSLSLTVVSQLQTASSSAFPSGIVGRVYVQGTASLQASGGTPPYTWRSTGLPAGLTATSSTTQGVSVQISGTPTTSGNSTVSFTVTDSGAGALQQTGTISFSLTIIPQLAISTVALPNSILNIAYSAVLASTGGTAPITWSATGLPSGFSINSSTGAITGTPTTVTGSPFSVSITAIDSGTGATQQTATKQLTLTVLPTLSVTTTSLASGTVGTVYSATLQAMGGVAPYTWNATGLPAGLSLNATSGVLSGTPTTPGAQTATITVTDSGAPQQHAVAPFVITIAPAVLAITTTSLPGASVNTAYSQTLRYTGGTPPVIWSVTSGSLPSGLLLNAATGAISGTPTTTGVSTFTVKAADSGSPQQAQTQALSITVSAIPLAITTTSLPNAEAASVYSAVLTSSGGAGSITWSVIGSLPTGLSLNTATGAITGTPTTAGTVNFTVKAADSSVPQQTQTANLSIVIYTQLTVTTSSLPNGTVGSAYSSQLQSSGGSGSVTWSLQAGSSLPAGLSLSSGGLISGTPSAQGTTGFTVQATDSVTTATAHLGILVNVTTLMVPTTSLPNGTQNDPYQGVIQATGGVTPYTISVISGSLPASLSFSSCNGGCNGAFQLTGTPTTTGTYNFTIKIADSETTPQTVTQSYSVIIGVATPLSIGSGSMASGEIGLPFSFFLNANGGTQPYTWALASASGPLPAGISINSTTGQITGSPTTVTGSPFSINVQVNDSASQTATQQMTITINAARGSVNNSEFKGQYAALMTGFDNTGNPLMSIVAFTADGNGNITSGVFDANGTGLTTPISNTSLTGGTYTIGSDNRGKLTFTSSLGTHTYVIALNQITGGIAGGGYITEFDTSGQTLTGTLALQNTSAFTTASISGGYAFGLSGFNNNSTSHSGAIGEVQLDGAGGLTSAEFLVSGSGSSTPIAINSGTYAVGSNGRGTLSFSVPNGSSGTNTVDMVFYVVSANKLFMLSADPASGTNSQSLLSGNVLQQTVANGSFTNATLHGTSVLHLDGLDSSSNGTSTTYFPDIQLYLATFDGAGNIAVSGDENDGGTVSSNNQSATYSVASNGRVTLAGGGNHPPFFYLVGSNQGFAMDFSGKVKTGYFEPQTATGFSLASLDGTYALGTLAPLANNGSDGTAVVTFTGTGSVSGTQDKNSQGNLSPDNILNATYTVGSNGRAVLGAGGSGSVVYIISATKALTIDLGSSNPKVQEIQH